MKSQISAWHYLSGFLPPQLQNKVFLESKRKKKIPKQTNKNTMSSRVMEMVK